MELFKNASVVMIIGMLSVFVFLIIMIFSMQVTAKIIEIINKYYPEKTTEEIKPKLKNQSEEEEIAVAIAAIMNQRGEV